MERENAKNREVSGPGASPTDQKKSVLNIREAISHLPELSRVVYRGQKVGVWCVIALMIIDEHTQKAGYCRWTQLNSQFGTRSQSGKYVSNLESLGLIFQPVRGGYALTVEGELFARDIVTEFRKVLNSKPSKRIRILQAEPDPVTGKRPQPWKKGKGMYVKRPLAPIETFNQLVNEVLSKKGLNKKVKYAMLRALGMKKDQAREAIAKLENGIHTERIKPILKDILQDLANTEPLKG